MGKKKSKKLVPVKSEDDLADELKVESLLPEINANYRECMKSGNEALNHAIQLGNLLLKMKEHVKHGEWASVIEKRCDFSASSAKTYMLIAKSLPPILKASGKTAGSDMTIRGGMKLIAESKPGKAQKDSAPPISPKSASPSLSRSKTDTPKPAAKSEAAGDCPKGGDHDRGEDGTCNKCCDPPVKSNGKISGGTTFDPAELTSESKDAFGDEAPGDLRTVFELCDEFDAQRAKITGIKTWITQRLSHPGAKVLAGAEQRIKSDLDHADSELKYAKPHCVCVYCSNKPAKVAKCNACKGLGWITEPIFNQAPEALKREKQRA